jgi:hypothetical protein
MRCSSGIIGILGLYNLTTSSEAMPTATVLFSVIFYMSILGLSALNVSQIKTPKLSGNSVNVYICTGEDFISLQLVSYPFVLFCMTIKYV